MSKLYVWIYFVYLFSSGELPLRAFLHIKSLLQEIISHVLCIRKQNNWRKGEEREGGPEKFLVSTGLKMKNASYSNGITNFKWVRILSNFGLLRMLPLCF